VFIDEIDAIGTKRCVCVCLNSKHKQLRNYVLPKFFSYESNSGGEREIQRTMLELLNQLDGFDSRGDVKVSSTHTRDIILHSLHMCVFVCVSKVIMATNRIDSLDPALIRPGRIDRKIEFPLPDEKTRRMIFKIHTGRMTLAEDVNLEELIMAKDDLSGADIKVCSIFFFFFFFFFQMFDIKEFLHYILNILFFVF